MPKRVGGIASKVSQFFDLGLLQGTLAAVSTITRSRGFERKVLQRLGRPHVRSRYGVNLSSNWQDATFNLCYFGSYGTFLSNLLETEERPFIFLDIGSNQGLYSLIAGKNEHCRAAIAFEPVPRTFGLLERNVAANKLEAVVKPVNKAVASEVGSATIRINAGHSGGASMASANPVEGTEIVIHTIDHVALDALIPDGPEVILVKIDVEGFESVVIAELLKSRHFERVVALFYEVDESWIDPGAIERMLSEKGVVNFARTTISNSSGHYDVLATR